MMWHVEEMSPMILQKPATWEEAEQLFNGGIDVYPDHTEANQAEANLTAANQTTVNQVGVSKVGMNQSGESNHTQAASDLEMFEKYLEADTDFDLPERGDLREGVIVEIRPNELRVNVGNKRDGVIPWSDLAKLDPEFVKNLHVGQVVDVVISKPPEDDGTFQLSMADALQQRDWLDAQELLENSNIVMHKVIGYNKGGLVIEFHHLKGFVPASHVIDMPRNMSVDQRSSELEGYIGSEMRLKVIEVDRHRRRLVMSQMLAEREYRDYRREQLFSTLRVGNIIEDEVRNLRPFGAFVGMGGVNELLHVSEIAWTPDILCFSLVINPIEPVPLEADLDKNSRSQRGERTRLDDTTLRQELGLAEYGYLTGCGKSSLLKAGLVPHLDAHRETVLSDDVLLSYLRIIEDRGAEEQRYTFKQYGRDESHSFGDNYLERGDLGEGVIIEIRPNELLVNVGSKRDGVIPWSDLAKLDPEYVKNLHVGQKIDVIVSKVLEDYGIFKLSIADALQQRDWITSPRLYDSSRLMDYESAVCNLLESRDKTKQQLEDDLRHPFLLVLDGLDEIPQSYSPERDALRTLAALLSGSILTIGDSNIYAHEQSLLWRRSVQAIGSNAGLERWQDADLHIVHFSGHGDATDGAMYLPCPGGTYSWLEGTPHRLWYCNGGKNQSCMRDSVGFPGKDKLSLAYTINRGHSIILMVLVGWKTFFAMVTKRRFQEMSAASSDDRKTFRLPQYIVIV